MNLQIVSVDLADLAAFILMVQNSPGAPQEALDPEATSSRPASAVPSCGSRVADCSWRCRKRTGAGTLGDIEIDRPRD